MQLEEEALNYSKGRDEIFKEEVTEMCETMENLIVSNLHPCHERKMVEQHIREVYLWARYCVELHGTK